MSFYKLFIYTLLVVMVASCGKDPKDAASLFDITIENKKSTYTTQDDLTVLINNKQGDAVDKVTYTLDGTQYPSEYNPKVAIDLEGNKLGKRQIKATVTSDGVEFNIAKEIVIVASEAPQLYTYTILETYPHDMEAYTQGLEFENDTLYESTGQRKRSSLRKTNYKTGEVLKKVSLADQYFGEGLTILNDKIYQLTWQENTGFIYDLNTMESKGSFVYGKSKEGWGLCNDGQTIYKSDGTEKIWTLNAGTLAEEGFIQIYTHTSVIDNVNELEWVDGKIYANVYQKAAVAIVNPQNGAVEGVIDLKGLKDEVTQHEKLDVLNGIAYNGEPNILYVTGKNWDKLFKIEIVKK
ncbi:MAG: glutaminyl-peptide cyclotransferase [Flavobacteriaceae bacterium]|nr:glutaminyl-peptide cyclotransferase [Flavobacteriaceae bacterium]